MTNPAEALIHELRNALVPLDIGLQHGTATLEDAAAVVKRLFVFADGIEADLRQPGKMHKAGLRSMDLCAIIVAREAEIDALKRTIEQMRNDHEAKLVDLMEAANEYD